MGRKMTMKQKVYDIVLLTAYAGMSFAARPFLHLIFS